ncbi:thiamine pyrophosphate-binding protein [Microbacteriaceae bacterium K1510]|nr:thiamine pyrophosphate-binding protein [Microbacteriaceae bacterium K1510]
MQTNTCGRAVVETLIANDLNSIYCVPGIQNDWFFNALYDAGNRVRAIHARHEQGAAYMALGAALSTGKPSVYSVVPGPGVLNTAAALATAYSANAPVLCLTGQIPSHAIGKKFGLLHEIPDQCGVLERLTKKAFEVTEPARAAPALAEAIALLTAGRPRPVSVAIPPDTLAAKGDFAPGVVGRVVEPEVDAGAVAAAARLIAKAERPMIVAGGGALDAAPDVRRLAELIEAPVYSYRMGRGTMDDRSPLSLTLPAAMKYWRTCDLVIGIGSRLQMPVQGWGTDVGMKFVRIDVDSAQLEIVQKADIGIAGRAERVVRQLNDELDRIGFGRRGRIGEIAALKAAAAEEVSYLEPQLSYLRAIREALGEDGILVDELTQVGYVSRFAYPVYRPRTYISSGYQGTLGWGYATALGVQHARPDAPVVSISGDGGFMFTAQEIATAVKHDIPLVAVVFNDDAYGNVRRMQKELYGNRVIATDLANPDFVQFARSFGIVSAKAESPDVLRRHLVERLAAREPALIEVPVGEMPDPSRYIMPSKVRGTT